MNKKLLLAGLATLILFPILGWFGVYFFSEMDPWELLFRSKEAMWIQLPLGVFVGYILGKLAQALVSSKLLKKTEKKYAALIGSLNLNQWSIIGLSLCAGIGEEILFRGAIQPFLGIWITAFIFVAIHGYLNPLDWRLSIYGLFMTIAIALLGYMTESLGILSAIMAHATIDYVLFKYLTRKAAELNTKYHFAHED
jgi:membrane protease YdiL (CAAX protease family)